MVTGCTMPPGEGRFLIWAVVAMIPQCILELRTQTRTSPTSDLVSTSVGVFICKMPDGTHGSWYVKLTKARAQHLRHLVMLPRTGPTMLLSVMAHATPYNRSKLASSVEVAVVGPQRSLPAAKDSRWPLHRCCICRLAGLDSESHTPRQ